MFERIRQFFNPAPSGKVECAWCKHTDMSALEPFRLEPNNLTYICRDVRDCNRRVWKIL